MPPTLDELAVQVDQNTAQIAELVDAQNEEPTIPEELATKILELKDMADMITVSAGAHEGMKQKAGLPASKRLVHGKTFQNLLDAIEAL